MLDRIQGGHAEQIGQSASLDKIKEIDIKNREIQNDSEYFIDESQISQAAYEKYEREMDIAKFSKILLETDEKEANELVLKDAFDGKIIIDNDDYLGELITNNNLLDDIN